MDQSTPTDKPNAKRLLLTAITSREMVLTELDETDYLSICISQSASQFDAITCNLDTPEALAAYKAGIREVIMTELASMEAELAAL